MSVSTAARSWLRDLVLIGPHRGAHRAAVRAGASMGIPLAVLYALGRTELSLFTAIGAFTAIFGREQSGQSRWRIQVGVGLSLVLSVLVGTEIGTRPLHAWIVVPVATLWAGAAYVLSEAESWQPPGPLFPVYALAASSAAPGAAVSPWIAAAMTAGSAVVAIAIGSAGYVKALSVRATASKAQRGRAPVLRDPAPARLAAVGTSAGKIHLVRYLTATAAAGMLVTLAGIGHPYWTFVTAVVPMAASTTSARITRAAQRLIGTLLGLALAAAILALHPGGLTAIAVVAVLQFATELFTMRNYSLGLVFFTPLALSLAELVNPTDTVRLLTDRTAETLLGLAIAIVTTLATHESRPSLIPPADAGRDRGLAKEPL
jgi:hypothetical protein